MKTVSAAVLALGLLGLAGSALACPFSQKITAETTPVAAPPAIGKS